MCTITPTIEAVSVPKPRCSVRFAKVVHCGSLREFRRLCTAVCAILVMLSNDALAEEEVPIQTTLVAEVLETFTDPNGKLAQRWVPAGIIAQGETVYYTVQVRNTSARPARDISVVQRIPANTTYVEHSASGPAADITFSVDGGRTFAPAAELTVTGFDGVARRATVADYTHIRWRLRKVLAPGAVALVRFQAVFR